MSPWLSKFPQNITFSPRLNFTLFDTFCFCSYVYHTTLLIDTNKTKSLHYKYMLMDLISLLRKSMLMELTPQCDRLVLMYCLT
jgi:hypothetical protein